MTRRFALIFGTGVMLLAAASSRPAQTADQDTDRTGYIVASS